MNVLVTGAGGYLGTALVRRLLTSGICVAAVDAGWFPDGMRFLREQAQAHPALLDVNEADVRNVRIVGHQIDAVCHLAGLSNDPMAEFDPVANFDINHRMTVDLAARAKDAGVGLFIFASSASVYDGLDPSVPARWDDVKVPPPYPYSAAKWNAERDLESLADGRFRVAILRQGTLWGVSPRMRYDLVVNTMVRDAVHGRRITVVVPQDGSPHWRPICHVEDCADVYREILLAPRDETPTTRRLNVVAENVTISSLANTVQVVGRLGDVYPMIHYFPAPRVRSYQVAGDDCFDQAISRTLFRGNGIADLYRYTRSLDVAEAYHPKYRNIDWLRVLVDAGTRKDVPRGTPPVAQDYFHNQNEAEDV